MISNKFRTAATGAVFGGALLFTAGLGVAQAGPAPLPLSGPDGLVNVVVGGATMLDSVPDAQAAQEVTKMCALPAPAVSAMAAQVDSAGVSAKACAGGSGDVVLVQNLPPAQEASPVVPGTSAEIGSAPAGGQAVTGGSGMDTLPTEPDNMSSLN